MTAASLERARVLVVDDNPDLLENLIEVLETAGYRALGADGVQSGQAQAKAGFDVALVDLQLPDGSGTDLAALMKERSPSSAVVLLTGHATVETAAAAVRAGAFAYLIKPCGIPELLLTVEQAMRSVRLEREKGELTRRAQRAERLAAAGTLTAGLSHEIRNPLNAASLQLAVLERRLKKLPLADQPPLLTPLQLVQDEIRRLERILQDFLQFARPRLVEAHPVNLKEMVTKVFSLLSTQATLAGVRIADELPAELPAIAGDEEQLRQVLMNLILNALEATPSGGLVIAGAHALGSEVELWIDDTGPGVPMAARERIFEPFFTTKAQGSGLGLPLVHALVTQHGGTLTLGEAPSGGARFTVTLPTVRT
jgi:two-component system sensor histidine kinase HydH